MCSVIGAGGGTCIGDACICGIGPDGGTTDGGTTDGVVPPPTDGGSGDGVRDGREGSRDSSGETWWPAATPDPGAACDDAACFEDCRSMGYSAGYCDPTGACACF